jgi:hypothetical protein
MVASEKGRPAGKALRVVRGNEFDQCGPRHHALHLLEKLAFAGFLEAEIEIQSSLFHGLYFLRPGLPPAHRRVSFAEFP